MDTIKAEMEFKKFMFYISIILSTIVLWVAFPSADENQLGVMYYVVDLVLILIPLACLASYCCSLMKFNRVDFKEREVYQTLFEIEKEVKKEMEDS